MEKCHYCLNRYGCRDKFEFDCKKNGYSHFENEGDNTKCDKCIHKDVCESTYHRDCENFQSIIKEEAEINWVHREKRIPRKECHKCGEVITHGVTLMQKVPYCSACGKQLDDRFMNYCPNCGKKICK